MCNHKNLKYFTETNKVVCLDCGKSFTEESYYKEPIYPYFPSTPSTPTPEYPYYPTVTWNKID